MAEFTIDPEFRDWLPKQLDEERTTLLAQINADGCRDPLVVWAEEGILVDGHHRYAICCDLDLPYSIVKKSFGSRDDVKLWMVTNQDGRRNWTPFQRGEMALKLQPIIEAKAAARKAATVGRPSNESKLEEILPLIKEPQTREVIGKLAGVSGRTIDKVEKILEHAPQDVIEQLRTGERGADGKKMTINKAYEAVRPPPQPKDDPLPLSEKQEMGWRALRDEVFERIRTYCRKCPAAKSAVVGELRSLIKTLDR